MVGGGIISRRPCTFSGDGKLILAPSNSVVNIYSAVTGERVNVLEGHTQDITTVILNPENPNQAYTSSLDGRICLWDYLEGKCLTVFEVRQAVAYMVIHKELKAAYLSVQYREGPQGGRVFLVSLEGHTPHKPKVVPRLSLTAMKLRKAGPLALSPSGKFAATIDKHSLLVWRTGTDINQPLNLHHTKAYTCLAFHPNDSIVAAGDVSGRILLWRDYAEHVPVVRKDGTHSGSRMPSTPPPVTTVHWHAHPVCSLSFNPDGTRLFSGGHEGTLVMWILDENHVRPTYLPRLGGSLIGIHVSPEDPAKVVLRQANNALRVVNTATLKVEASIFGILPPPLGVPQLLADACAQVVKAPPGSGVAAGKQLLVLPAEGCNLQWYDPVADKHVRLLQVVARNQVDHAVSIATENGVVQSPEAGGVVQPFVQHVAFSPSGATLVTVDLKPMGYAISAGALSGNGVAGASFAAQGKGAAPSMEASLKFWNATGTGGFAINTRVEDAHNGNITSLAYHPFLDLVVTTGGDSGSGWDFRVWVKEERGSSASLNNHALAGKKAGKKKTNSGGAFEFWRCRSVASYRNRPLSAATFSIDGSVLALAAGNKVTLWDAMENSLIAVLPSVSSAGITSNGLGVSAAAAVLGGSNHGSGAPSTIRELAFVPGTPYLAAATPRGVTVYNILTADVHWSLPANVLSLGVDAGRGLLAVAVSALPCGMDPSHSLPLVAPSISSSSSAGAGGAAGGAGASPSPAGGHAVQNQAASSVVVSFVNKLVLFDPASPAPVFHATLPSASSVKLLDLKAPPAPEVSVLVPHATASLAGRANGPSKQAKKAAVADAALASSADSVSTSAAAGLSMLVLMDGRKFVHTKFQDVSKGPGGIRPVAGGAVGAAGAAAATVGSSVEAEGSAAVAAAVATERGSFSDLLGHMTSDDVILEDGAEDGADDSCLVSLISNDLASAILEAAGNALATASGSLNEEASTARALGEFTSKVFDGPSHSLPAPSTLVETYLAGLLAGSVHVK